MTADNLYDGSKFLNKRVGGAFLTVEMYRFFFANATQDL